ncbi:FAD-dependent oxidoreductase [Hahella sp. CR1]|uniref:NAD(P)/FAD-dependent oxidoreductase n=1 Tax=Hahella sp. CR1 TaxID=2992807 RepID=UPI0024425AB7|nr:FAD-dependent oxidoreductase [Hahella sp. CR1]MDG9668928.1 FAD-dependent oxidoreductase [Hahella sp. CR1]
MPDTAPIVIIGTGLAGYTLAREFRKLNKDAPVLMLTADDGHSYSKPMLSTGFAKAKTADQLSMADPGKMAEQLNIEVRTFATVTALGPEGHRLYIGDEVVEYSKLVLAWGADLIHLNIPGSGAGKVFAVNDLMDYRRIREALQEKKRVAILGAGLIGCEFANDLLQGGYEVELIAPSDTALPGMLPKAAGDAVVKGLQSQGAVFHLGQVATAVEDTGDGVALTLDNGVKVQADIVLSAVGLRPRTSLAKHAGVQVNRGIVVDREMRTSAPDVYALGDCAEVDGHVLLYVLPLMACAKALAKSLAGEPTKVSYGVMPVVVKTPACPVVVAPPPVGAEGDWQVEQSGECDVKALFVNAKGALEGFALTGAHVMEKQKLAQQLDPIHND